MKAVFTATVENKDLSQYYKRGVKPLSKGLDLH